MGRKYNYLTKTKIASGLQCEKKLWFDVHQPIKKKEKATFKRGIRFGDQVIKNYSQEKLKILDLSKTWPNVAVKDTLNAIKLDKIDIIFEAAFEFNNTLVRTDVLIKKKEGWDLIEAKSSTKLKPEHIPDVSIQSYIVRKSLEEIGKKLLNIKLIHINTEFVLKEKGNYKNLINDDNDLTNSINEKEIQNYIKKLLPITSKETNCPKIDIGLHCDKPYPCDYIERCKLPIKETKVTPYTILPYIGKSKELIKYMEDNNTNDLQKVPPSFFKDRKDYTPRYHQIILTHSK